MKIKKNITIELSEQNVKEIIADYITNEGYTVSTDDINISIGSRTEGYGLGEHETHYFKGIYIKCQEQ